MEFEDPSFEGFGETTISSCNCGCPKSVAFGRVISAIGSLTTEEQKLVLKSVEKYINNPITGSWSPTSSDDEDETGYGGSGRSNRKRSSPKRTNELVSLVETQDDRIMNPTVEENNFTPAKPEANVDEIMDALKFLEEFEKTGSSELKQGSPEPKQDVLEIGPIDPESDLDFE